MNTPQNGRVSSECERGRCTGSNPDPTTTDHASGVSPFASGADRSRMLRRAGLALCLLLAGGMLIWFKLRVVTGVPRQAYADPETTQKDQPKPAQAQAPEEPGRR